MEWIFTYGTVGVPASWTYVGYAGTACTFFNCESIGDDPQVFEASADGTLCEGCLQDTWTINERRVLENCSNGT